MARRCNFERTGTRPVATRKARVITQEAQYREEGATSIEEGAIRNKKGTSAKKEGTILLPRQRSGHWRCPCASVRKALSACINTFTPLCASQHNPPQRFLFGKRSSHSGVGDGTTRDTFHSEVKTTTFAVGEIEAFMPVSAGHALDTATIERYDLSSSP